mgnify:CR=1 FL=1
MEIRSCFAEEYNPQKFEMTTALHEYLHSIILLYILIGFIKQFLIMNLILNPYRLPEGLFYVLASCRCILPSRKTHILDDLINIIDHPLNLCRYTS